MAVEEISVAAATAVVGYNLLGNSDLRQAGYARRLTHAALAGSAAALDTIVEIKVGAQLVARLYSKATGAPLEAHRVPIGASIPANAELSAVVTDAPATNPINLQLVMYP